MPPVWLSWLPQTAARQLFGRESGPSDPATVVDSLTAQWKNPRDILSVLLLLGPEIVQHAVAQLAGRIVTPVAFSFGWVAYSSILLLSSVGGECHLFHCYSYFTISL